MNRHRFARVFWLSVLFCVAPQASSAMLRVQHDRNLSVWLKEISREGETLTVLLQIENRSYTPLWVCTAYSLLRKERISAFVESRIVKDEGKVFLKVKSAFVPRGVHLYAPIYARYRKVPIRGMLDVEFQIRFPVSDESPFVNKQRELVRKKLEAHGIEYKALRSNDELETWAFTDLEQYETSVSFEELQQLSIELGYYKRWFFYRDIWGPALRTTNISKNEKLINCFWAMRHPERSITFTLDKKTVEQFLQQVP